MDRNSVSNQGMAKTTPSSHRDFFAKLYGSLEEEYNKKRELESQNSLNHKNTSTPQTNNKEYKEAIIKPNSIEYINPVDVDSEDERDGGNESKEYDASLSPPISPGSSPNKDEEISPPRIPPPTLKQLKKRFEVSAVELSSLSIKELLNLLEVNIIANLTFIHFS